MPVGPGEIEQSYEATAIELSIPASRDAGGWEVAASSGGLARLRADIPDSYDATKRAFDLTLATLLLVVLFPLLLLIAASIAISSPGPALLRQRRHGRHKTIFEMFKFRTMTAGDKMDEGWREEKERVTRIGRFLRITGLDELPQLVNVIRGDMSLIGPRPHVVAMDDHFEAILFGYSRRYDALPGISGLAQVRGHRGPIVEMSDIEKRLSSDLEYIRRRGMVLDLLILVRTLAALVASLGKTVPARAAA
jgi:putative colanic acid biosynthesis UDP-glucose lipid carrier transferase